MRRRIDIALAMTLLAGFLIFLILAGSKSEMNFDAAYNLLSYQSLFDGKGFVYTYNGENIPFDPTISTGPELYLPTFLVWLMTGETSYFAATYVLVFYYGMLLVVLLFWVLKNSNYKTVAILAFLFMFFCNRNIFNSHLFIIPVGEPVAAFFLFTGIYCLHRRALFPGFLLLGLALDTKTNVIVGLLPVLVVFGFIEYVLPVLKGEKKIASALPAWVKVAVIGSIILVPYLAYTKIAPAIVLGKEQKLDLKAAQRERSGFMIDRGFGQIIALKHNFNRNGMSVFGKRVLEKFSVLRSMCFEDSRILLLLFVCSYPVLLYLSFKRGHYSLYLFLFLPFMVLWWVLGTTDPEYRYLFVAELAYGLGIVSLVPALMESNRIAAYCVLGLIVTIYAPRISLESILLNFGDSERRSHFAMAKEIEDIDERKIFTYGWYQAPQLMFLTHKRFQNYLDTERLEKAKEEFGSLFFLTTSENAIMWEEMEKVTRNFEFIKFHSNNRLYRIKETKNQQTFIDEFSLGGKVNTNSRRSLRAQARFTDQPGQMEKHSSMIWLDHRAIVGFGVGRVSLCSDNDRIEKATAYA